MSTPIRPSMPEFARRFRELFPDLGPANLFIDPLLSTVSLAPHLDPLALEEAIERKHGAIPDGTSLAKVVADRYGEEAARWAASML